MHGKQLEITAFYILGFLGGGEECCFVARVPTIHQHVLTGHLPTPMGQGVLGNGYILPSSLCKGMEMLKLTTAHNFSVH